MRRSIVFLLILATLSWAQNHAPEVTNVTFSQRNYSSYKVDIYYDLYDVDSDAMTVTMQASNDAGQTWNVSRSQISGDVGDNITSGTGKHIVWDFGAEHPDTYWDQVQVKITADDGYSPPVSNDMVYVQGGTFTMGDTWGDGDSDERSTHNVMVNSFYMGKYEVTQAQYQEIMGNNPSSFKGDNRPVESVS